MFKKLACLFVVVSSLFLVPEVSAKSLTKYVDDSCNHSHTFFVPRQTTMNNVFGLSLNNYQWYTDRDLDARFNWGLYGSLFNQQTAKSKKLARYFFKNNECNLTFREINENPCDIESLWFQVEADVNMTFTDISFSMKPQRHEFGGYFNIMAAWNFHEDFSAWLNISFAALKASHDLRMKEVIDLADGPLSNFDIDTLDEFTSVVTALQNEDWKYGKFACKKNRSGLDDIQVRLGLDWFYREGYPNHFSPYIVFTAPTGKGQRSKYIFEPVVGSKNASFGIGFDLDYTLVDHCPHYLTLLLDAKYRYVVSAEQCRSFDLCKNGDWSRYLLVVPQDQTLDTRPGINLFTLRANVTPRSTIDLWTALHYEWKALNVEFGYDFWWRQKEKVDRRGVVQHGFGIFDLARATTVPLSASCANISQAPLGTNQAPSDDEFVLVDSNDLDLDSGAHPTALSSTIYLAAAISPEFREHKLLFGLGFNYEIAHRIAALEQWGIWGKVGIVF